MTRDPRVLVAGPPGSAVGGVATHTAELVDAMPRTRLFDQWWPLGRRSSSLLGRLGVHAFALVRFAAELFLRRPDLVHLQVTDNGLVRDAAYLSTARLLRVPVLSHLHSSLPQHLGHPALARIVRESQCLLVMSGRARDEILSAFPEAEKRIIILPNPVQGFPGAPRPRPRVRRQVATVLCVGEISAHKGQYELFQAIETLNTRGNSVRLRLVGPWGEIGTKERRALETSPIVDVLGVKRGADLAAAYDSADVFALNSRAEAEPLSMLEAMSRGLPVVATSVGSIPETLAGLDGNVLVERGAPETLTSALASLIADPDLRDQIGQINLAAVEPRSIRHYVRELGAHYATLTTTRPQMRRLRRKNL
ncbi:hypothetical protein N802_00235 [Knoellia sinensis KCTC 19936]|uniref:D-inositol 3-phosphate glycosyltransferase n=1 Tax=Knoellia sinensis KCTC 19936 TaxID=1385520 RepID=A0A0A0JH78_9MICO|nr:glycosyltransferase family 4 protein [Knoellia sinensis]KGN34976.1 hypothetical protein N802_00235 [Knoellia sinensis KCTC 19936]